MDATLGCLSAWMPMQRWYAAKGRQPILRRVAEWELGSAGDARVSVLLVEDAATPAPIVYQVPLVERARAEAGVVGRLDDGTVLVDGTTDPAYTRLLYEWVTRGGRTEGTDGPLTGEPFRGAATVVDQNTAGELLSGEQSNTSIVFRPSGAGQAVICKVFRQVHPGVNPDIELQTALADSGSPFVPGAVGATHGAWRDVAGSGEVVSGSLAFAQEFLPDVEDAWRVALQAAREGTDFTVEAAALGRATAAVHLSLADLFPTRAAAAQDVAAASATWRRRLAAAAAEVAGIAAHVPLLTAAYERAESAVWPHLQRIHGDLHLGQVLHVPQRGWVLLDFEGEPLRPMTERRELDVAVRDVAGMLRSFDYVAGSIRRERPDDPSPDVWAGDARSAFLAGYSESIDDVDPTLLRAFELDKAVYEALYEVRNRPDWLAIPLTAIERLVAE